MTIQGFLLIAGAMAFLVPAFPAELSTGDRQRIVAHLEMTEAWLVQQLGSLTPAQLAFQPSDDAWSIHNVVEHLAVAEPQYWQQFQDAVKKGSTGYQSKVKDSDIMWYGIDRTSRAKTGAAREPKGQFATTEKAVDSFRKLRASMMTYAKSTKDDLRGIQLTDSSMDVYQWFLMISSHSQRHLQQILEIRSNPKFPKG